MEVLNIFKEKALLERFHDRLYELSPDLCITEAIGKGWRDRIWSTFGDILTAGTTEQVNALSERIWSNTLKPVQFNSRTTLIQWLDLTSGPNLRWPVVGILLCLVGIASRTLIRTDPIFGSNGCKLINSKQLATRMWKAAEVCVSFCREFEVVDDLFVLLLIQSDAFTSRLRGESSKCSF